MASFSPKLIGCFAKGVSNTVRVRNEVARPNKLRELELEGFSDLVSVTKQSDRGFSEEISARV